MIFGAILGHCAALLAPRKSATGSRTRTTCADGQTDLAERSAYGFLPVPNERLQLQARRNVQRNKIGSFDSRRIGQGIRHVLHMRQKSALQDEAAGHQRPTNLIPPYRRAALLNEIEWCCLGTEIDLADASWRDV